MAKSNIKRTSGPNIKSKEKQRLNRLITAAASRAGASKEEISSIRKALWQVREIVSRDRDAGITGAAASIANDVAPEYAIAAINRLSQMGIISEDDAEKTKKLIDKKYPKASSEAEKIQNKFNQAADIFWETGIGLVGPRGRQIGANNRSSSLSMPIVEDDSEPTGKNVNRAFENMLLDYYQSIGIMPDMDPDLMPVQGYLVHRDHEKKKRQMSLKNGAGNAESGAVYEIGDEDIIGDGLTAHGDIEIILKPGVSSRTSYGLGEGMLAGHNPVKLNSTNKDDVMDAISNISGKRGRQESLDAMLNLLASSIDSDFSNINAEADEDGKMRKTNQFDDKKRARKPLQAQILGGFDVDEIEQINYPFTKLEKMAIDEKINDLVTPDMVQSALRMSGMNEEEIEYLDSIGLGSSMDTESMKMLRNYRYAQKLKKSYADQGVKKFKIAHPFGIDIDNPLSHSKSAKPGQRVEEVLVENIRQELIESGRKLIKELRKPGKPSLITRRGNKL
jgi:hypothetical protein